MWRNPKTSLGLQSPSSSENATARSGADGNGGFGVASMTFDTIRNELAPHTTAHGVRGVPIDPLDAVRDAVRTMQRSLPTLSRRDQQLLKDVKKGRYVGGVLRVLEIARECEDPADATALPEAWRGFVVAAHPGMEASVYDSFRLEQGSNGATDLAQVEFLIAPTEANRQRALEFLNQQMVRTRKAIDALHRHRGR